jgi:hypothetical protein
MRMSLALAVALSLVPQTVDGQEVLALRAGFTPDPRTLTMKAGGDIEVDMGECTYGYIAESAAMGIEYRLAPSTSMCTPSPTATRCCSSRRLPGASSVTTTATGA